MKRLALTSTLLLLAACAPSAPPAPEARPATPSADAAGAVAAKPRFVDRVWRVESSTAVAPGMLYTFLTDGTLVMQAPQSTPGYGRWTYENDALVMIEEGIAYPTDILALDDSTFSIRSHNPGEPVDIKLVAADNVPLPKPPAK